MLTLRKKHKHIEISHRTAAPFLTIDLMYAFLIALALHVLPLTFFNIKKLYFAYSDPIIHSITIAPSTHDLRITTESHNFPAPSLPTYFPLTLPPLNPLSISHFVPLDAPVHDKFSLSPNLKTRLLTPASFPEVAYTKLRIKVDDKTGKLFYYESASAIQKELHDWLMSLNFERLDGSFVTSGILEIDTQGYKESYKAGNL